MIAVSDGVNAAALVEALLPERRVAEDYELYPADY